MASSLLETARFPVPRSAGDHSSHHPQRAALLPAVPAADPCEGPPAGRPAGWRSEAGRLPARGIQQQREKYDDSLF